MIDDLPAEFWPNNSVICLSGISVGTVKARKLFSFMPDRTDVLTVISPKICDYGISLIGSVWRQSVDAITKTILDTIKCVGGDEGLIYVTVPITSGYREFRLMNELGLTREEVRTNHKARWREEVVQPNEADAEAYSLIAQLQFPDRIVLNPAMLQVAEWTQDQYNEMWNEVLRQFCDVLMVTPDWAYSYGARKEVKEMALLGREIVDMFGNTVKSSTLNEATEHAEARLIEMGWSKKSIDATLPPMTLKGASVPLRRKPPHAAWNEAFEWIVAERRWQRAILSFKDDEMTREDGSNPSNGRWEKKLQKYLEMVANEGIDSVHGGIHLLQFVSLCVAMMESVSRVHGPFPEPGLPSLEIREGRWFLHEMNSNQLLAVVFAWLRREYFYTIEKYASGDDDENTREGIASGSWWDSQLKIYWNKMCQHGLDTPQGRQMLGKYTSTAMNLATSRIRVYGKVASPDRLSFEELEERKKLREGNEKEIPQLPLND